MAMDKPGNGNLRLLLSKLCSFVIWFHLAADENVLDSLPKRDWRDWFIMATVMGGVGYGFYLVAKVRSCDVLHLPFTRSSFNWLLRVYHSVTFCL
jgi:hypothetical protein